MIGRTETPALKCGRMDELLALLYGRDAVPEQRLRYKRLIERQKRLFSPEVVFLFSTPGRTELGGNHTDHNHGRVLAAAVQLDSIAAVTPSGDALAVLHSEGFPEPFEVDLSRLERRKKEEGTTGALIRGIAAGLEARGFRCGGFKARVESRVLPGSGLSSSASIEVLIGTIFNHLYNDGSIDNLLLARIGQEAENHYFGKPCGLMDQIACAEGGIVAIDFEDLENPQIDRLSFDFQPRGYSLMVVNTGGSHADQTPEYAAIPAEMKSAAVALGKKVLRELTPDELYAALPGLRRKVGDRALLRCLHFFKDNERVVEQAAALKEGRIEDYLRIVNASGSSSWKLLQNCYVSRNPARQGITLALAVTEEFLQGEGACRVHGGGFAGTIQAYLPVKRTEEYVRLMENLFGNGSVTLLRIRREGTKCLGTG